MNERIKELARRADEYAEQNVHYYMGQFDGLTWEGKIKQTRDTKFAEMIVRECADLFVNQKYMILNPHEPFANERVRALKEHDKDTVRKVKEHFGVEE
jgi:hypothetical protein